VSEVNPNPDDPTTSAWETFALLRGAGYDVYWFDGEKCIRGWKAREARITSF